MNLHHPLLLSLCLPRFTRRRRILHEHKTAGWADLCFCLRERKSTYLSEYQYDSYSSRRLPRRGAREASMKACLLEIGRPWPQEQPGFCGHRAASKSEMIVEAVGTRCELGHCAGLVV
jgi:hypothetical protein